ncbi:MAG: ribose-phosphate pyrophosphokinase [Flavobacteriales bacterium]|nr:ribose-phosphate pyrophosphokinase [Flavobacteriales bacterium]
MRRILFTLPGNEGLATAIATAMDAEQGALSLRHFPDGESYVRILSDVKGKQAIVVCTLHRPDEKLLPLMYLCRALKDLGATTITLVAPYLSYMRQDKAFQPGEAVTSAYFAALLSSFTDGLVTIDPHLHRRSTLQEIYTVPCEVLHASSLISAWIKKHVKEPVLIGPDSESEQWVSVVAHDADAPFTVLEKTRLGDADVRVTVPHVERYADRTPVLVDDIISTARTMIETVGHLKAMGLKAPWCIGTHGVFAGRAYEDLLAAGAARVITCNTIPHSSNAIDVSSLIVPALEHLLKEKHLPITDPTQP